MHKIFGCSNMLYENLTKVTIDTSVLVQAARSVDKNIDNENSKLIRQLDNNRFVLEANARILTEYERVLNDQVKQGKIHSETAGKILKLVRERGHFGRFFVDPVIVIPPDFSDNHFFASPNCLGADYLITSNSRHFEP